MAPRAMAPHQTDAAPALSRRTVGVLRTLRANNTDARVVALAVLPRGWTDPWHVYDWPSMYKGGIDIINRELKDFAAADDAVTYLDCGPAVTPGGKVLKGSLTRLNFKSTKNCSVCMCGLQQPSCSWLLEAGAQRPPSFSAAGSGAMHPTLQLEAALTSSCQTASAPFPALFTLPLCPWAYCVCGSAACRSCQS